MPENINKNKQSLIHDVMPSTAKQKCACCGNEIKNKPIKIMHHQINRYVCSEECMWNFYK